ncbi:(4Fe-4S)-binding protein [bacterium (candidate division B38) B3_B38]|nr:MAG: (4Fe-4S)-binding protein [bacterium (candidate division B38) B3_B38]
MRNFRRTSQIIFLLLFLWLLIQTEYHGKDIISYPVKVFLDFDPLILFSSLLAAHGIPPAFPMAMFWGLVLVGMTLLLGRFFCGWVCPLGTLHHFIGWLKNRKLPIKAKMERGRYRPSQRWKYLILIGLLVASVFTLQVVGLLDPLSLFIRSLALSINPAVNYLTRAGFNFLYFTDISMITAVSEPVYSFLKTFYLSFKQPFFQQSIFLGLIFLFIVGLNFYRHRYWCRYLCPLGALLGVLSRYTPLRLKVSKECTNCMVCVAGCEGGAEPHSTDSWRSAECVVCWNCVKSCPKGAVSFVIPTRRKKDAPYIDVGRRRLITSAVAGLAAVPLLRVGREYKGFNPELIRPPGALAEGEFLRRCVRCGECMKVCLTNAIHPALLEAGLEGLWTPMLVMKMGYCEYYCTLCGQVCPTGAIRKLPLEEKQKLHIGTAFIDKSRCIPYTLATNCIVCEEHCPTPKKAIWFEEVEVVNREGERVVVKQPRVDPQLCIGCGVCEYKCPVIDKPAIYVTSIGESRSPDNQLII